MTRRRPEKAWQGLDDGRTMRPASEMDRALRGERGSTMRWTIDAGGVGGLQAGLDAMRRLAVHLGIELVHATTPPRYVSLGVDRIGLRRRARVVDVEISASAGPRLGSFEAIGLEIGEADRRTARLVPLPGASVAIHEVRQIGREARCCCHECADERRCPETLVLAHGRTAQVVRLAPRCAARIVGPRTGLVAQYARAAAGLWRRLEDGARLAPEPGLDPEEALALGIATARACGGFVSRRAASVSGGPSTADRVMRRLDGEAATGACGAEAVVVSREDRTAAAATRAWVRELAAPFANTYLERLAEIGQRERMELADLATWISAPEARARLERGVPATAGTATVPDRGYIGRCGDRVRLKVTIAHVHRFERGGHQRQLVSCHDEERRLALWFDATVQPRVPGARHEVDALVREHRLYRGVRQSVLGDVVVSEPLATSGGGVRRSARAG